MLTVVKGIIDCGQWQQDKTDLHADQPGLVQVCLEPSLESRERKASPGAGESPSKSSLSDKDQQQSKSYGQVERCQMKENAPCPHHENWKTNKS